MHELMSLYKNQQSESTVVQIQIQTGWTIMAKVLTHSCRGSLVTVTVTVPVKAENRFDLVCH